MQRLLLPSDMVTAEIKIFWCGNKTLKMCKLHHPKQFR